MSWTFWKSVCICLVTTRVSIRPKAMLVGVCAKSYSDKLHFHKSWNFHILKHLMEQAPDIRYMNYRSHMFTSSSLCLQVSLHDIRPSAGTMLATQSNVLYSKIPAVWRFRTSFLTKWRNSKQDITKYRNGSSTGLILGMHPANERLRYNVTPSLVGWAQASISALEYTSVSIWICTEPPEIRRQTLYRI